MDTIINYIKDEKVTQVCNTSLGFLLVKTENFEFKNKFAIFDLDGTLIVNSSKKRFFVSVDDWKLRHNVKQTLKKYNESGYSIGVFIYWYMFFLIILKDI